jgi:hypothetical protein
MNSSTDHKTCITSSYQRKAYSSYVKRKNDKSHEKYDPSFRAKVSIHQKIYYQRKKKKSLTSRLEGMDDQEEINKIKNQIQKCSQIEQELIKNKAIKYNYSPSSEVSE